MLLLARIFFLKKWQQDKNKKSNIIGSDEISNSGRI
jgi:hypothetical protein